MTTFQASHWPSKHRSAAIPQVHSAVIDGLTKWDSKGDNQGEKFGFNAEDSILGLPTDRRRRTKPDLLFPSQRPFSSIRAAIKRTKTNSPSENTKDHRRPQITIISAEPLVNNNWFSGASLLFPPPLSDGSAGLQPPPSYEQVINEKTRKEQVKKPTPAPRQHTRTTTFTQTEVLRENTACPVPQSSPPLLPAVKSSKGKTPQKPPRPLLPKSGNRKCASETARKVATSSTAFRVTGNRRHSKSDIKAPKKKDLLPTYPQSVIVHWDTPADSYPVSKVTVSAENTSSYPSQEHSPQPVPLPRTKSRKQPNTEQTDFQTLIQISESSDCVQSDQQEISSNEYLKELLEVFTAKKECEESNKTAFQSNQSLNGEDEPSDMNNYNSQNKIQARIQAFESQASAGEEHIYETIQPQPLPRNNTKKPPIVSKPPIGLKPSFSNSRDDNSQNESTTNTTTAPIPAPRSPVSKKPGVESIRNELEALHSQGPNQSRPRPVLSRASCIYQEDTATPVQPVKEPLQPNLNINNHNSAGIATQNEYVDRVTDHVPNKPQSNVDSKRESIVKRPTTIRVPSKNGSISDSFQDGPPPLPVRKPVGSLNTMVSNRQSLFEQGSLNAAPQPRLPPRKPSMNKPHPPRPPLAKQGPGRPPQQRSTSRDSAPVLQKQKSHKEGLALPPRPNPGHSLYNKYTLHLPHGIASCDYNGNDSQELSFQKNEVLLLLGELDQNCVQCQTGEAQGRVQKSHMKVITPLPSSQTLGTGSTASAENGYGLTVQAVHDFIPEGPGELSLKAGDVVTMVEQVDSQWYKGTCGGSAGFFPVNYVKILSNSPKPLPERKPRPLPEPVSGPRCVARFDFEGKHSDELSFSEGDVILLKEYLQQDWARGQVGDFTGIFPLNYVEVIEDLPSNPTPSREPTKKIPLPGMVQVTPKVHQDVTKPPQGAQSDLERAVALYDYTGNKEGDLSFQQGDSILITQYIDADWGHGRLNNREGMFPLAFVETKSGQHSSNTEQNEAAGGESAKSLYNFTSDNNEELSLQVGDILTNIETIDEEWFMGDLGGKRGLFPRSYVQVLG
ncbi:SH3 domain-containing protein 19 [Gouania willdenowi]|uniref:SH3 domain-containing protein 19 n=1 Tax=Gouania willdenowi TaxID=441366 RepID=UPI0010569698|nr:SH3 domain-containing protein 19 [Gouania willdenowi]